MKMIACARVLVISAVGLLMACASTSNRDTAKAPASDDLLELLTGFGESLSKRNFARAVDFMVPEEKAMMMEGGSVPADKQKLLLGLPLQKLIRHPAIRVENGKIAGIYTLLPGNNPSQPSMAMEDASTDPLAAPSDESTGDPASDGVASATPGYEERAPEDASTANDPRLQDTVNRFFAAVNKKNWTGALALMNDNEKKLLLDEKGRLKESSKKRLSHMDQTNKEALVMQNGKLMGVTLLLPSD